MFLIDVFRGYLIRYQSCVAERRIARIQIDRFVIMVLLSRQTLSEYLRVLELKSPIRIIDPKAENFSISFLSSSNSSGQK